MKLLFLHIGKTGGTTMRRWLAQWYAGQQVYPLYTDQNSPTIEWTHQNFDYDLARQCDLVMGHYDWSIRRGLPEHNVIAVLRHPVDRLYSQYRQYKRVGQINGWNEPVASQMGSIPSFDEFVHHPTVQSRYGNYQAKILAGIMWGSIAYDPRMTIKEVAFLGIQERLDSLMDHVAEAIGVRPPKNYGRLNRSVKGGPIADSTRRYIEREHQLDFELYRLAQERVFHAG